MGAFQFAGSIRQVLKRLTRVRVGGASAVAEEPNVNVELTGTKVGGASAATEEPNVNVEYNVSTSTLFFKVEYNNSSSHPKLVIRFCFQLDDEQRAMKMMAANSTGIMD
ncbi:unnamed protein product [Malus baccata var. baccata]